MLPLLAAVALVTGLMPLTVHRAGAQNTSFVECQWTGDDGKITQVRQEGGQTVVEYSQNYVWTNGTLLGPSVAMIQLRINADGTGTGVGYELFNGTVAGHRGTLTILAEVTFRGNEYRGTARSLAGSGELSDARLFLTYVGKILDPTLVASDVPTIHATTGSCTGGSLAFGEPGA